jgi:hypothetical protein
MGFCYLLIEILKQNLEAYFQDHHIQGGLWLMLTAAFEPDLSVFVSQEKESGAAVPRSQGR